MAGRSNVQVSIADSQYPQIKGFRALEKSGSWAGNVVGDQFPLDSVGTAPDIVLVVVFSGR